MEFDLIVRNGIIVILSILMRILYSHRVLMEFQINASDTIEGQDIGIKDGIITCIGQSLPSTSSTQILDTNGAYITPGGVDSHVHLEQWNTPTGDTWETGSRSAICGGTTTIVAFVSQARQDESVIPLVEEYSARAAGNSYCDYGLHLIMTNPTPRILQDELPVLAKEWGITSVKLYMTYDLMKLRDREILDIMTATRRLGMTTMVHAENHDMIDLIIETLEEQGKTEPYYHAVARPTIAEAEATHRAICLAELMDAPILLVHVSSKVAAEHIRRAQTRLLPIYGETCPQYLWLLAERLKGANFEGAKAVCSPPLRETPEETDAIWRGIANGTFTTFSSDHAASKFHVPNGKKLGLIDGKPLFRKIPNGLPGLETRLPLLFKGVLENRISIQDFVRVACSNPAKLYGLPRKGAILPGNDADLCVWYPSGDEGRMKGFELVNEMLHHDIDYTPYEGIEFANWPRYTILRGKVVWDRDGVGLTGKMGDGRYTKRTASLLPGPRNFFVNEWRPPT
ncbi:MAG: hypothetical protein M1827_000326 [Pycnora praestabilis]|nr:MAG: hypothetical protein M1827_000326 [Pycnora praestabilis]